MALSATETMRLYLYGDPDDTRLGDALAASLIRAETQRLTALYPCLALVTSPGDDYDALQESLGYYALARLLRTPLGRQFSAQLTTVKIGPVTKSYAGQTLAQITTQIAQMAGEHLALVSCIGKSTLTTIAVSGRWHGTEGPKTVEDQAYGPDDTNFINN